MTTFRDKMSIVAELTRGITPEFLAELHHTTEEEINQIAASHKVIVEVGHYMNISQGLPLLTGHYPVMENILFCWWSDHGNVKNKTLSEKARQIVDITGEMPKFSNAPMFTGTMNWVRRFKDRFRHHFIEQSQTVSDDADMQTDPVLLSVDEIKMKMEFESEAETLQSQNFDEETSTFDELSETVTSRIQPGNNTEFVTSSPEEVIESESPSKRDGEIENSQVDDHAESSILTEQKPSTAADEKEISPSENFVNSSGKNFRKRKSESIDERPTKRSNGNRTTDSNTDEDSSSQDFDESVPIKKRRRKSEKILVQTKAGVKSVNFKDYKEGRVIRMFKPLLKFAKDNQWTPEDCDQLNKLYRKSLLSCGGKETKQLTITTFFRKKK